MRVGLRGNRLGTVVRGVVMAAALLGWATAVVPAAVAAGKFQGSFDLLGGFPQGDFHDNIDDPGGGLALGFGYRFPGSPLLLGADVAYILYGHSERTEPFSSTIPDVRVKVSTENSIVQGGVLLRLQPPAGVVRPYLDGVLGFNYLFTKTTIRYRDSNEEIAGDTNLDDGAFAYGLGGGLMVRVYRGRPGDSGSGPAPSVHLEARARYMLGGEARYLKEGSVRREGGRVFYDVHESKTDLLTAGLGVVLEF